MEYVFTAVSAWLIPGAGHWLLGYKVRGVLLGAPILGLFWVGQVLALPPSGTQYARKPLAVSRQISPVFFACQVGNGFSGLLSNTLWGSPRYPDRIGNPDRHLPRRLNLAVLFTCVSGLLNYLLVLHVIDPDTWRRAARHREKRSTREEKEEESS